MPFTLAHPVAALPLCRALGRYGVPSALAIGSMAPDFWYFMPLGVTRAEAHSYEGLLWFCLPAALFVYLVFHALVKWPLLGLLPESMAARLAPYASRPPAGWLAVLVSFLVGMATHLACDAFTHYDSIVAEWLPVMRAELFSFGDYDMHTYTLLQHGGSLLGMAALGLWAGAWLKRAPEHRLELPFVLTGYGKACVLTGIAVALAWGAAMPVVEIAPQSGREAIFAARAMARTTLAGAGYGLVAGFLAYALVWKAWAWRLKLAA